MDLLDAQFNSLFVITWLMKNYCFPWDVTS